MAKKVVCRSGKAFDLHAELHRIFGFNSFKGNQEAIIESILLEHDVFVIMPTGGGKSLCYQLPAMLSEGTAIIISPLISLMKNQVDAIREFGDTTTIAHFLNSSLAKNEIIRVKEDIVQGRTKLLYVAPESLIKEENVSFLKHVKISFFAIDEAHCISEWGHDFRPEYRRLRPIITAISPDVPIIALTATATPKVQQDIVKNLEMHNPKVFVSSFDRENLFYEVRYKSRNESENIKEIIKYIRNNPGKSGIIYCLSRKRVEDLAQTLKINNIKALPYHAGLDAYTRADHQDKFLNEEVDVIVATIAFGMGIDKPDVRFVIHYDMPKSLEGYYQETGRAGRDEGEGHCIAFYNEEDVLKFEKFLKDKPIAEQEVARQLMEETISYAEYSECRRISLLNYFGETYGKTNCGSCDNCVNNYPTVEATEEMKLVLETVLETKQLYRSAHIVNVIMGVSNTNIRTFKHDQLSQFGEGVGHDERFWNAVVRQAVFRKFLVKDIETYGVLKMTEAGNEFLRNPYRIMVKRDHSFRDEDQDDIDTVMASQHTSGGGADDVLLVQLKNVRRSIAKKEELPPYIIFEDRSLEDMTIQYPISMEEMCQIVGVGQNKAAKYGKPFLELIKKYVEENEIERPQDIVVKSVINKSGLKVYIIKSIDRKFDLEDIALAKNLTMEELIMEMESIVSSGTKLHLDYYVNAKVDPYHLEDIMEYFRSAENNDLQQALQELGSDEYSELEVRLVRLYFQAQYAQ